MLCLQFESSLSSLEWAPGCKGGAIRHTWSSSHTWIRPQIGAAAMVFFNAFIGELWQLLAIPNTEGHTVVGKPKFILVFWHKIGINYAKLLTSSANAIKNLSVNSEWHFQYSQQSLWTFNVFWLEMKSMCFMCKILLVYYQYRFTLIQQIITQKYMI